MITLHNTFEIVVIDDASQPYYRQINAQISKISGVIYIQLDDNIGRSRIRNHFLQFTRNNNLLFIDCDAEVAEPYFLKKYLDACDGQSVIVGGVAYKTEFPAFDYSLRWTYGHKRESTNAFQRSKQPYHSFKTFNFLVPKDVFNIVKFDESLVGYGHEDTLFGLELKRVGITIKHIENPLIHLGLETNELFLTKTRQSIENLLKLYYAKNREADIAQSIRLLNMYSKLSKYSKRFINIAFLLFRRLFEFNLNSKHPSMKIFDLYKLGYICSNK
jgi:glycosyltransferase involved in cell wall biosynthesis